MHEDVKAALRRMLVENMPGILEQDVDRFVAALGVDEPYTAPAVAVLPRHVEHVVPLDARIDGR